MANLLLVDDDPGTLASLKRAFQLSGHEATVCNRGDRAIELAAGQEFDLIFSDVVMPGMDGVAMLEQLRRRGIATPVVMISGQATNEMAVRATRLGAADFLEKPLTTERLLLTLETVCKLRRLERENEELRERVGQRPMIGTSPAMARLQRQIERLAPTDTRVCIFGETGTGKELVARALHAGSRRCQGPFVALNCAAVPAELIESELFGHEKGSFTGAASRQRGRLEQAHRGTLFLDEIGDMPAVMQAKLLRVLEEGTLERIGGATAIPVDVRILSATHRDLAAAVERGTFREDLFHRIVVFPLPLPPLRDRKGDIPLLCEHFARSIARQNGWKPQAFSPEAIQYLESYAWPGNIRELRNLVERLLLLSDGTVEAETCTLALPVASRPERSPEGTLENRIAGFERETVLAELRNCGFRMAETARRLGLERSHLYKKCQQLGINLRELRASGQPGGPG